jgi:hypothetical protein
MPPALASQRTVNPSTTVVDEQFVNWIAGTPGWVLQMTVLSGPAAEIRTTPDFIDVGMV